MKYVKIISLIIVAMLGFYSSLQAASTPNTQFTCPNGNTVKLGDSVSTVVSACESKQTDQKGYLVARPSVIRWNKVTTQTTYDKNNQPLDTKKINEKHAIVMIHGKNGNNVMAFQFLNDQLISMIPAKDLPQKSKTSHAK
ncbi:hypothetical protein L3V82_00950 [Thiotrichales bacterium 19S3-7]|nr:hypothetical protein [Thiotrichales bacterium 19S3-7]MCF6800730.1 hypothetical protein [Thiotrichales bacterium 19S3-11]